MFQDVIVVRFKGVPHSTDGMVGQKKEEGKRESHG
jgi:hypothetical protein